MANPEAKLQSEIVIDFSQQRPNETGRLFASFSELLSSNRGGYYRSMGLVKSLSDLMWIDDDGYLVPLEIKYTGMTHTVKHLREQAEMMLKWTKKAWFIDSKEMFWEVINTGQGGISPVKVLQYIEGKKSSIKWDSAKIK